MRRMCRAPYRSAAWRTRARTHARCATGLTCMVVRRRRLAAARTPAQPPTYAVTPDMGATARFWRRAGPRPGARRSGPRPATARTARDRCNRRQCHRRTWRRDRAARQRRCGPRARPRRARTLARARQPSAPRPARAPVRAVSGCILSAHAWYASRTPLAGAGRGFPNKPCLTPR